MFLFWLVKNTYALILVSEGGAGRETVLTNIFFGFLRRRKPRIKCFFYSLGFHLLISAIKWSEKFERVCMVLSQTAVLRLDVRVSISLRFSGVIYGLTMNGDRRDVLDVDREHVTQLWFSRPEPIG